MTSQKTGYSSISKFTLSLMEDTGWYKVDYSQTEELEWGKGKGCGFLNADCSLGYEEYCGVANEKNCTPDYIGKALCTSSSFSDTCLFNEYFSEFVCTNQINFVETSLFE